MDENSILTSQIAENGNTSITALPNKQQHYIHQATAKNTRKAYQSTIKQYETYGGLLPCVKGASAALHSTTNSILIHHMAPASQEK